MRRQNETRNAIGTKELEVEYSNSIAGYTRRNRDAFTEMNHFRTTTRTKRKYLSASVYRRLLFSSSILASVL